MKVWMLTDDAGRVLALNRNDMTGNSGWSETTVEALGLDVDADLHDARGAALYKLVDGAAVLRDAAEREADYPQEEAAPAPAADDIAGRVSAAEQTLATHDEEINQIVTGLEALNNGQ